jgi:hypothetical protein
MNIQVPTELKNAFMKITSEEKRPASGVLLDLMQDYVNRAQGREDPKRSVRADNMQEAWASVGLEGYRPSEFAKNIGQQYIDGKITAKEQVALIRAHHGLTPNKEASR